MLLCKNFHYYFYTYNNLSYIFRLFCNINNYSLVCILVICRGVIIPVLIVK